MRKVLFAAVIMILISGCTGKLVKSKIEDGITKALPKYIGPAKKYSVKTHGSSTDMLNGLIDHLHIEGTEVQIDPSLLVNDIVVDMYEVRYNKKREVQSARDITFTANISETAVNSYIESGDGARYSMRIVLSKEKVYVTFIPKLLGFDVLVKLNGRPRIVNGDKVDFLADRTSIAHLPIPRLVVNQVLEKVNPILDMSLMKFPVELEKITVNEDSLDISGHAVWKPAED